MDQDLLKTSAKQRAVIIVIAFLMIFSFVATYIIFVLNNGSSSSSTTSTNSAELTAIEEEYSAKSAEISEYAATLSDKYLGTLKEYKSRVKSYNATTVNTDGLTTTDLKEGTGRTLEADDTDYFAYYIGWCADETIFDSSFDSFESPTALSTPIAAGSLIEGWNQGVIGMKLDGVREIAIPGELAYGETQEICGGTNSPLKFIVLPFTDDKLKQLNAESDEILERYYTAAGY